LKLNISINYDNFMFNINENEKQLKNLAKKTYINIVLEIDEN